MSKYVKNDRKVKMDFFFPREFSDDCLYHIATDYSAFFLSLFSCSNLRRVERKLILLTKGNKRTTYLAAIL